MQVGVFLPIGNNGWLISTTSPHFKPSFDLNRAVVERAERYGMDFALSMIKLRGFGGPSEFWDYNLESFTLMAGLAAVTSRIQLFATCAVLTVPPAFAARMTVTIDSISHGRFGLNMITGWQEKEYAQMGIWPGESHHRRRYDYCGEYVTVMRELWESGRSDFKGDFFQMDDCRCLPTPSRRIPIICAGQSDRGTEFAATYADYNFCSSFGINDPHAVQPSTARLVAATAQTKGLWGACRDDGDRRGNRRGGVREMGTLSRRDGHGGARLAAIAGGDRSRQGQIRRRRTMGRQSAEPDADDARRVDWIL